MKTLYMISPQRLGLLKIYLKKYIKNFRAKKCLRSKKNIIFELVSFVAKCKIKGEIKKLKKSLTKFEKLTTWLRFIRSEQKQCLKQLWNNFIPIVFKSKDKNSGYFKHCNEDLTFQQLFAQKLLLYPQIKLDYFFKNYEETMKKHADNKRKQNRIKRISIIQNCEINKFNEELVKQNSPYSSCILPFSIHSNMLKKPKGYDIPID